MHVGRLLALMHSYARRSMLKEAKPAGSDREIGKRIVSNAIRQQRSLSPEFRVAQPSLKANEDWMTTQLAFSIQSIGLAYSFPYRWNI